MKNKRIIFLLYFFGIIIFFSCRTTKEITESPIILTQTEKPNLENWKQIYVPDIKIGDSIFFYNSVEIIMEGEFFNRELYLNGAINITNNKKVLEKTVPAITSGELVSLKKDQNGKITDMYVKFSLVDKTYIFDFKVTSDGSFNLNGNAKLFFQNKEYPVLATIKGDACKLLCVLNIKDNIEYIKEKAEGVN